MKQRFLSLLAVASMSIAAMAQSWTAPVEPTKPEAPAKIDVAGSDIEDGGVYFIRNVGCEQFITGANDWGTQISVSDNNIPVLPITVTATDGGYYLIPVAGTYLFHGNNHGRENYSCALNGSTQMLFRDDAVKGYVDLRNQNRGFKWNIWKSGNYYRIQNADLTNFPNSESEYAAATAAGAPVVFNAAEDAENIDWEFIARDAIDLDALNAAQAEYESKMNAYNEQMTLYNAQLALYNLLVAATKYGASTDAAGAVYNNAASTVEELNNARTELLALMPAAVIAYATAHGTASAPEAMPYVIANSDFSLGNINGWTIAKPEGATGNYQYQGATYKSQDETATIQGFIESWVPAPNHLGDVKIYQEINGLPNGHYILECDAMAVNQTNPDKDPDNYIEKKDYTGVYLFYSDGSITVHGDALASDFIVTGQDADGYDTYGSFPAHFTYEFDLSTSADKIQIGLMSDGTNLNWMGADNFVLKYAGAIQALPSYTALQTEVATSEAYLATSPEAQVAAVDAMRTALTEAQALTSTPSDDSKDAQYQAAFQKLNDARSKVVASVAAYARIDAFLEKLYNEQNKYGVKANYDKLIEKIEDLISSMESAQSNFDLSADEINAAIDGYDAMVKETVQEIFDDAAAAGKLLDEPLDITSLFTDMTFPDTNGADQQAYAGGYPSAENPVWVNETGTGNFKTNYGTVEVWDARPFNIYRDFTNLPKGKYTVKTHAFFRVEANDSNYPAWQADNSYGQGFAYLYAGRNNTPIINVASIACPEFADLDAPYDCTDGNYMPNNQHSASMIFTDSKYAAQAEQCYIGASASVIEDNGTLRVGVAGTSDLMANHWTIWYDFELYYEGVAGLDEDIQNMLDQLELLDHYGVAATSELIEKAKAAGEAALGADEATQTAAIKTMQEAINASELSKQLTEKIQSTKETYQAMVDNLEGNFNDTKVITIIDEIDAAILADEFESNEKIQEWLDALPGAWYDYVLSMQELDEATEDNAVELPILVNGTFDDMVSETTAMPTGWTAEFEKNGGKGREGVMEFWNASTFDIYQDLPKLKNGYYRLCVDGLYRAGASNDENGQIIAGNTPANDVYFYAQGRAEEKLMQWSNTENGAIPYALADKDGVTATGTLYDLNEELGGFDAPNNQSAFSAFIAQNRYHNTLVFGYGVDGYDAGTVRIGLKKTVAVANDWCPFDNFKLEYLGAERPTAVNAVETDTNAAPTAIFTLDGRQSNRLSRGVNIVRQANGKVVKVLVK